LVWLSGRSMATKRQPVEVLRMSRGKIRITEEKVDPVTFNELRRSVGWETHREEDLVLATENSTFFVTARDATTGDVVGMGRIIGDSGMFFYIQDIIVRPRWQGMGIGGMIMDRIMEHIRENGREGLFVGLMSAEGKEGFYARYGFKKRPAPGLGAGMCLETENVNKKIIHNRGRSEREW